VSEDLASYKAVVGRFATGVVVVSAMADQTPVGFTCQTFGSLSLEPRLVSFSAAVDSTTWPRIRARGVVGISVLADDQEDLARRFAQRGVDRFAGVRWHPGPEGSPLLDGVIAHLEGMVASVQPLGDHEIAVVAVHHAWAGEGRPLVYLGGRYGGFIG
jgi:flavin reductase (DIM6/NTAB) family NADH-FMN oxidoreductase RutF